MPMIDVSRTLARPRLIVQKQIKRVNMRPIGNLPLVRKVKNMLK